MKKLLLVDGSNIVMRAAFGGDIEPYRAVDIATGLIQRAIRQSEASHMVIAMDADAPSWRKLEYPNYKADRTVDTTPWLCAAHQAWCRNWYVEECGGFEADDIIATLADRARTVCKVSAVSNDSDILTLTGDGVEVLRPVNGGTFCLWNSQDVCLKYGLLYAQQLTDHKAMCGESGDNVPGVPGIGPKRASNLLNEYGKLEHIIEAGSRNNACKYSKQVFECRDAAMLAYRLVSLRIDAPIVPIKPNDCLLK